MILYYPSKAPCNNVGRNYINAALTKCIYLSVHATLICVQLVAVVDAWCNNRYCESLSKRDDIAGYFDFGVFPNNA